MTKGTSNDFKQPRVHFALSRRRLADTATPESQVYNVHLASSTSRTRRREMILRSMACIRMTATRRQKRIIAMMTESQVCT